MATYPSLTPGTNVEILPLTACNPDPVYGVIKSGCLTSCCTDATGDQPWCEEYVVEYYVKGCCDRCDIKTHTFCRNDLVDQNP